MSKVIFTAIRGKIEQIIDSIMAVPEMASLSDELQFSLRLAAEELVANVINYAYPPDEDGTLEIDITSDGRMISVTIADSGAPFNPLDHEDPDITLSAEEREIGGLGIFLVKEIMDEVEYEYADGQNRITIRKSLLQ